MTWAAWSTAGVLGFSLLAGGPDAIGQTVSIAGLFTTGVNNSNALLGNNVADAHYVVDAPLAVNDGNSRTVTTLAGGWVANTTAARWITTPGTASSGGGSGGANTNRANGIYDYTLTFTMPAGAQLNTVSISGAGAVDDTATILVNGTLVAGQSINNYTSTNSFSLNSANATFTATTNTITFRTNNSGGGPTGMIITSLSGTVVVPEVGAILPIVGALVLFASVRVGRRWSVFG